MTLRLSDASPTARRMQHVGADAPPRQPAALPPPEKRNPTQPPLAPAGQPPAPTGLSALVNPAVVASALRVLARPAQPPPFAVVRSAHRQGQQVPAAARISVVTLPVPGGVLHTQLLKRDGDDVYLGGLAASLWSGVASPQWHMLGAAGPKPIDACPNQSRTWVQAPHVAQGVAAVVSGTGEALQFVPLAGGDTPIAEVSLEPLGANARVAQVVATAPNAALVVAERMVVNESSPPGAMVGFNTRTEHTVFWVNTNAAVPTGIAAGLLVPIGEHLVVAFDPGAGTPQHPQLLHLGQDGVQHVTALAAADGFRIASVVVTPDGKLAAHECRDGEERVTLYRIKATTGQLLPEASSTATRAGFGTPWRLVADAEGCVLADTGTELIAFRHEGETVRRVAACPFRSVVQPVMSAARMVVGQTGDGTLRAVRFDGTTLTPVPCATSFSAFIETTLLPLPDGRLLGTVDGGRQLVLIDVV